ncbi:membrane protein [Mycobacterium sp. ST-F2]|uniref:purine-cytosine permease family protein n=1 Tax=Mycobacterium sp. ST-F2 TaxID=1490484 RepID=UPI00093F2FBB|nr:cytosine permease [Mycobacterium sp. ST-F2]OKH82207.1 membrane protein [Mycobacterium sp. ST-F2]
MTQDLSQEQLPLAAAPEVDQDRLTATRETLEDYTLRFAPRSYRKWSTRVVGISALGGIAYLADFAIGANIGISYGTTNALAGIAIFAVVILLTGFPVAYYSARYNIDLDLVTRGSGFGYYGSVVTNVIFATFTFIFFALEGSIMAQGLKLGLGLPLWLGYAVSTLIIFPLVIYGMKVLSTLQVWTTPLWLILMVAPFVYLLISHPASVGEFFAYQGKDHIQGFDMGSTLLAAGVCLSLIAQIAEQNDYLRFMPPKTPENKRSWWTWMFLAGPGWVFFGAIKQVVGLFLAVYLIANVADSAGIANQPVHQFLSIYENFLPGWLAMTLAVVLVVISQIKINVTNAYSGSLAWTNSYTRVTNHYPGRLVFLGVNLLIALILMEANMFDFLSTILGFYANCGMAWVVVVASDIVFNKYLLKLSPKEPEFRRGMLYAFNPVGFGSMLIAAGLSVVAFFGGLGSALTPYSPLVAIGLAVVLPPIFAIATKGKYYLRRTDDGIDLPMYDEYGNPSDAHLLCQNCHHEYERPDMLASAQGGYICSLCLATDKTGEHVLPAQK